ncbi:dethiobiotin synthase [Leptospira idonii]|uniref:ATP-dependent dethiobiotin synthetase BioD n=1 Tax=Leptospira idonii TaxID=1193500 RepID=A0A4R9M6B4_9LEPT|nr:dethiobiotin synthase [Leptospira idonii]TGN20709.1 dethiobiotin synthase [Leptospira idonii]
MSQAFFIAGTGTDVGKTFFSSLFLAKYGKKFGFQYWKPIQTGLSETNDTAFIQKITDFDSSYFLKPIYELDYPASPHFAAKRASMEIDPKLVLGRIAEIRTKRVLIEGAGGIFVPWTEDYLSWKGIQESNLKVIVIGSSELGTINHTLLTLEALLSRFIPVMGFYLVGPKNDLVEDNMQIIQKLGGVPSFGYTGFPMQKLSPSEFIEYANLNFDIRNHVIGSVMEEGEEFDS